MAGERAETSPFFEQFQWPLPRAFGAAIATCRFELGDVLFSDASAYESWSEAGGDSANPVTLLQVLAPPRSARSARLEGDGDRRRANWSSEARIVLVDGVTGESEERVLTQGKLLMAIWQGDVAWLNSDRPEPEFPRTARDLHSELESTRSFWAATISSLEHGKGSGFVMAVDLASDAALAKATLVEEVLRSARRQLVVLDRTPEEVGLASAVPYHPTVILRALVDPGGDADALEADLQACLYRGGEARPTSTAPVEEGAEEPANESAPNRFSIGRHGILVEYEGPT